MRRPNPLRRFRDPMGLAGWLFADLMVALTVLFFAANTRGETVPPPRIASASPLSGLPGTQVSIDGDQLQPVRQLSFGQSQATVTSASSSRVVAVVPDSAATGPITLQTDRGTAYGPNFVVARPTATPTVTPTL